MGCEQIWGGIYLLLPDLSEYFSCLSSWRGLSFQMEKINQPVRVLMNNRAYANKWALFCGEGEESSFSINYWDLEESKYVFSPTTVWNSDCEIISVLTDLIVVVPSDVCIHLTITLVALKYTNFNFLIITWKNIKFKKNSKQFPSTNHQCIFIDNTVVFTFIKTHIKIGSCWLTKIWKNIQLTE